MRPLTETEAAEVAAAGEDPSRFVFDESTGEAVENVMSEDAAYEAQSSGDYSLVGESLKAIGRGLAQPAAGLLQFIGKGGQAIDEALGLPRTGEPGEPSSIGQLGDFIERKTAEVLPTNPQFAAERTLLNPVMQGLGQFGGMLIPGAGAAKLLGSPMAKTLAATAPALGAGMEGSDALERAQARGDSPGVAVSKAIGSAAGAAATESLLGAGRMVRNLAGPAAGSVKEFLKGRVRDMAAGGTEEAIQRAIQDAIVEGKLDWDAIAKEGGIGAIVQGLIGGAGGAAQALAAPKIADASAAATNPEGSFSDLAGTSDQGDVDLSTTPWKAKDLTDDEVADIVQRDEWDPVIKTEFDDAVKEAKKRNILTPELTRTLQKSDKPLADLDAFVRTPRATQEARAQASAARVVKPLDASEITALRNIKADDTLPINTPLLKGVQKLRKANLTFGDDDIQALNRAQDDKEADAIVQSVFLRAKMAETPMNAAEAARAIENKNWDRFGKEFKEDTKRIDTAEGALKKLETEMEKATLAPSERWKRTGELESARAALNQQRTSLMQKYLSQFTQPTMAAIHVPRQASQGPAIPVGAPTQVDPAVSVDPFTARDRTLQLPAQAGNTQVDTQPSNPTAPNWIPGVGDARQALSGYAEQAGMSQTPEQRLFDLQSEYGVIEGYRIWEGEQGLPFDEGKTEDSPKTWGDEPSDNPEASRSFGFPKGLKGLYYLYKGLGSIQSDMASKNPAAAYVAARLRPLFRRMNEYRNKGFAELKTFKKFFADEKAIAFIRDAQKSHTWDVNKLPADLRADATRLRRFLKAFHVIQNNLNIAVWRRNSAGVLVPTKAKDDPGYFPDKIRKEVYEARRLGGEAWQQFKRDYINHWKANNPTNLAPGWQARAEDALSDLFPSLGSQVGPNGQPEYRAVYIEQGIGLPDSWKQDDAMASLESYIDRWSKAIAWAEIVQKDQVMRKVFGITEDPSGKQTAATDPRTFRAVPKAFAEAVREGKRSSGKWVDDAAAWIDRPIETYFGKDDLNSIRASYQQLPSGLAEHSNAVNDSLAGLQQVAGSLLMQTPSAVRDVGQAFGDIWTYIPARDWGTASKALLDVFMKPRMMLTRAQQAGAVQVDQYAHEAAGMIGSGFYKAAKAIRTLSLKNAADAYAKTFVYSTVENVVTHYARNGMTHELATEFGPVDTTGMTPEQIGRETAAAVVDRVQPSYDARNMGFKMLPQNREFLGTAFALSRWSVAKFGKWYEDVWTPAMNGKPQRLLKNLFIAGALGSVVTQELLSWLTKREPQELTIREWWGLDDELKREKAAVMAFGYLQAQGAMGIVGDIANGVAKAYDKGLTGGAAVKLAYPPAIVYQDWAEKVLSFANAASQGYVAFEDVADLGLELMKSAQNVKVVEAWIGSKPDYRDRRIHEELYGLSARTGNPKARDTGPKSYAQDPFSLTKRLKAAGTDEGELRKLLPVVAERAAAGSPVRLTPETQSMLYYIELANRRGIDEARRQYERDSKRDADMKLPEILVDALNKGAPKEVDWRME